MMSGILYNVNFDYGIFWGVMRWEWGLLGFAIFFTIILFGSKCIYYVLSCNKKKMNSLLTNKNKAHDSMQLLSGPCKLIYCWPLSVTRTLYLTHALSSPELSARRKQGKCWRGITSLWLPHLCTDHLTPSFIYLFIKSSQMVFFLLGRSLKGITR